MYHFLEDVLFGGTGYVVIRILGFGWVRSDYESTRLLRFEAGRPVLGWLLTNIVGALFWAAIIVLGAFLI